MQSTTYKLQICAKDKKEQHFRLQNPNLGNAPLNRAEMFIDSHFVKTWPVDLKKSTFKSFNYYLISFKKIVANAFVFTHISRG